MKVLEDYIRQVGLDSGVLNFYKKKHLKIPHNCWFDDELDCWFDDKLDAMKTDSFLEELNKQDRVKALGANIIHY